MAEAFPFKASRTGSVHSITAYVASRNNATTLVTGLYADDNGHPGARLAAGSLSSLSAGHWNTIAVSRTAVASGHTYWITVMGKGGNLFFRDRKDGSCMSDMSGQSAMRLLPSAWTRGSSHNTCPVSAYASGTVAKATSTAPTTSSVGGTIGSSPFTATSAANSIPPLDLPTLLPPVNIAPPAVSGSTVAGQTLTTSNGSWLGSPTSYSYSWQDCDGSGNNCSAINGASSSTYSLTASDISHTIRAVVTAGNDAGSASSTSGQTSAVSPPPVPSNTALPVVSGSTVQGSTLSTTNGSWSNSPTAYGYQWQRCAASCSNVAGATGSSYVLQAADVGDTIDVVVTATSAGGSTPATSQKTAGITASGGGSGGCDLNATASNFSSQVAAASPGQTVCLASGSYGSFSGAAKAGPAYVTIQPQSGASVSMSLNWSGVSFLKVDGVTITSANLSGRTHDVTVADNTFTGDLDVNATGWNGNDVLFDHNTYNNISNSGGRIEVWGNGSPTSPVGVTIQNSTMSGGDADGIQLLGGEYGTQILGNTFTRLDDGATGDGNHTDAIQVYGGTHDTVKGNFFYNQQNMAGCSFAEWDGSSGILFEDNVVAGTPSNGCYDGIDLYDDHSSKVIHNVFAYGGCLPNGSTSPCGNIALGGKSSEGAGSGTIVRDNICTSISNGNGGLNATYTEDHNLCRNSASGTGDIKGSPTFAGGANPTTFAGFALASGSAGVGGASDGTNIGIELPSGG